jgi:hypothetical protein
MQFKALAVAWFIGCTAGAASAQMPSTCADRLSATPSVQEILQCLKDTAAAAAVRTPAVTNIPSGAVLAFDLPDGCPVGWSVFKAATGRSIIGAGDSFEVGMNTDESRRPLSPRKYRQHGGEERHVLTIDEMPAHDHRIQESGPSDFNRDNNFHYFAITAIGRDETRANPNYPGRYSEVTGKGEPYNVMSPFVALHVCKKD